MRLIPTFRRPRLMLLVGLILFLALCLSTSLMVAPPSAVPTQPAVMAPQPDVAPAPQARLGAGVVIWGLAAAALGVMLMAGATTEFGAADGYWDTAANWSNGVPTASLSAIVSSASGIPILPATTSAVTTNLTGGGTIGLCAGNVNILKITAPSANTYVRLAPADVIERNSSTSAVPKGHG